MGDRHRSPSHSPRYRRGWRRYTEFALRCQRACVNEVWPAICRLAVALVALVLSVCKGVWSRLRRARDVGSDSHPRSSLHSRGESELVTSSSAAVAVSRSSSTMDGKQRGVSQPPLRDFTLQMSAGTPDQDTDGLDMTRRDSILLAEDSLQPSPLLRLQPEDTVTEDHFEPGTRMTVGAGWVLQAEIGRGAYATVWDAIPPPNHRVFRPAVGYVLKISKGEDAYRRCCEAEYLVHQHLLTQYSANDATHIALMLDGFYEERNGKKYFVQVGERHGQSLLGFVGEQYQWQPPTPAAGVERLELVKAIVRQCLLGLEALHESAAGYLVHCDVKPENILLENATAKTANVWIADLGTAHMGPGDNRQVSNARQLIQTREYRAPEVVVNLPTNDPSLLTPKLDTWSLGCLVFELLTGTYLFHPRAATSGVDKGPATDAVHLQMMIDLCWHPRFERPPFFGPPHTLSRGSHTEALVQQLTGNLTEPGFIMRQLLSDRCRFLPSTELPAAASFILSCLILSPDERPTCREMRGHPWVLQP